MERERLLNVPNVITCVRIGLMSMFFLVHFTRPDARGVSMALFMAAGATDFLDGLAARKLGQITWLGKLLDPLADKLMVLIALVCLMDLNAVPVWLLGIAVLKEMYMVAGGTFLFRRQVVIASDLSGKISTLLFVPAVVCIYPWHEVTALRSVGMVMLYASLFMSIYAAVHYTRVAVKKSITVKTD